MLTTKEPIFEDELFRKHMKRMVEDQALGHFSLVEFDKLVGGIRPGRLAIIAGEPGVSKTTFVNQLADDAAENGFTCIVNSLEVPAHQLVAKSIARGSNGTVSLSDFSANLSCSSAKASMEHYEQVIAPNICFIESPCSAVDLSALISHVKGERGDKVILFVDYAQIMPTESEQRSIDERQAILEAISGLRRIANRHDVQVIAISSINRLSYGKGKDSIKLNALGGCSAIEYSADLVLYMAVDESGATRAESMALPNRPITITALKNRYGRTGSVHLELDCEHATFRERE